MGELKIAKTGKQKHSHILTNILKFTIFTCVMLAPFFSVLSKCLYVACNKNAKDSYYGETINEKTVTYNTTSYQRGRKYYINIEDLMNTQLNGSLYIHDFDVYEQLTLSDAQYNDLITNKTDIMILTFQMRSGFSSLQVIKVVNNTPSVVRDLYPSYSTDICILEFYIDRAVTYNASQDNILTVTYTENFNKYSYLDNVFTYSIEQLNEQSIFNWTKYTGIYTAVNSMTTGLGFIADSNVIAILLSYWAINTAVYIIFDIVIWCFTKLTHFLND